MNDAQFLEAFESLTLPFEQWTHRAHVKTAFLYLSHHAFGDALTKMRTGIKAFNAKHDVPDNPTSGYNETTTVAFLHLVAATMAAYSGTFPAPNADAFCDTHTQLMNCHALRLFYTPQRRMHPDAKQKFIEPDLAPLPKILDRR